MSQIKRSRAISVGTYPYYITVVMFALQFAKYKCLFLRSLKGQRYMAIANFGLREGNGLFAGKPVPIRNEDWIRKDIHNVGVCLYFIKQRCYIQLYFQSPEHRDKIMALFPKPDYDYEYRDSPKEIKVQFPVLDKGKNNREDWPEIREKLVSMGSDIYNKISESDT